MADPNSTTGLIFHEKVGPGGPFFPWNIGPLDRIFRTKIPLTEPLEILILNSQLRNGVELGVAITNCLKSREHFLTVSSSKLQVFSSGCALIRNGL